MAKKLYGIIGHPVGHSLSPAMHNSAFKALDIDAEYKLFDVEPEGLDKFLEGLCLSGISGLNVTIPHKIKAKEYIESNGSLDENAKRLGAVNTIKALDKNLKGCNTDGPGFYRSLVEDLKFEPEGKNILVLGAGGAATAIVMYLGNGPKNISIFDVDNNKTSALMEHYKKYYDCRKLNVIKPEDLNKAAGSSDLLVNATPIGMKESDPMPIDESLLHPGLYIYDLVYNQPMTKLVRAATRRKLHAATGLGMLLYQGVIAFEIWTDKKAPVDVMKRALKAALKG